MKASLQLKVSQNLTMTPQLQQAIKLLQLSSLELQTEIQQMLENNPLLESESESIENEQESGIKDTDEAPYNEDTLEYEPDRYEFDAYDMESMREFSPDDLSQEISSDPGQTDFTASQNHEPAEAFDLNSINSPEYTLSDHLISQLNLCRLSERDSEIAHFIIDELDDRGYLTTAITDLANGLNKVIPADEKIEEDEILAVLHRVQQFDPVGIAAQNLQECLLLQLKQLPKSTAYLAEAIQLIDRYIHYLESKDFTHIRRKTRFSESTLTHVLQLIQSLNPNPASEIVQSKTDYIVPDIIIRKHNGKWLAELNENSLPKIKINEYYASLVDKGLEKKDKQYLKNNLQEARWFIKSLNSRHETLLRVAREILEIQGDFFEYGDEAMKPLVLHDIAERVDMHESTISRVTTQKYMLTPKGVFELKYFFSSHIGNDAGENCSSTAIRAHIKKMISGEDPKKPLSDSKIAKLLADQEIKVARRTIAKYREALSIPPSNERKKIL